MEHTATSKRIIKSFPQVVCFFLPSAKRHQRPFIVLCLQTAVPPTAREILKRSTHAYVPYANHGSLLLSEYFVQVGIYLVNSPHREVDRVFRSVLFLGGHLRRVSREKRRAALHEATEYGARHVSGDLYCMMTDYSWFIIFFMAAVRTFDCVRVCASSAPNTHMLHVYRRLAL